MSENQNVTRHIQEVAEEKFFTSGFSRITTEEIARDAGISKKTLYKLFPTKENLMRAVITMNMKRIGNRMEKVLNDEEMPLMEKTHQVLQIAAAQMSRISRPLMQDLARSVPHLWKEIEQFREKVIREHLGKLIQEGRDQGFIRGDLDTEVIVYLIFQMVQHILTPELLIHSAYTASDMFAAVTTILYGGILTEKGRNHFSSISLTEKESGRRSRR